MFRTIQIIFGVLGLVLAYFGNRFSIPALFHGGIVCLGFMAMAVGWEGIITQQIVVGSRRHGSRQTYTGLPAILQGVQFNLIGIFLIGVAAISYLNYEYIGREIFLQFVRRPGIPLVFFGVICLMQAIIVLVGSLELSQGPRWIVILNLLVSRLLPGIILVVIGLGAIGLSIFEIVAPGRFDEMGGGFLEVLYGIH